MSLLSKHPDFIYADEIFIQPTFYCAINCKGCYVKDHQQDDRYNIISENEKLRVIADFFYMLGLYSSYKSIPPKRIQTKQLTVAMDEPPKEDAYKAHMMSKIIYLAATARTELNSFELHYTAHSEKTFLLYELKKATDVISLSNIYDLDIVKKHLKDELHVNYNHLVPRNVTSFNIKKHLEKIVEIGRVVDSIHLVINKTPTGKPRNNLIELGDRSRLNNDLSYIKTILEKVPLDVKRKINIDGCVKDVDKYRKTGFGCSANISKFHLWPHGTVSGCPYAFDTPGQSPAKTHSGLLDNFLKAKQQYEFKSRCHLPALFDSVSR